MFHYYDHTHPLLPYAYSLPGELSDGEYAPDYTIPVQPEKRTGYWPVANSTRTGWDYIEDHRQHMDSKGTKQGGTPYWLPADGDDYTSPPRYMDTLGPLPDGAVTARPEKPAPTVTELFSSLRAERDRRIAATDYLVMPDYPLTEEAKATVSTYRQALRDLPQQAGAPWDGGGDLTPWPPAVKIIRSE